MNYLLKFASKNNNPSDRTLEIPSLDTFKPIPSSYTYNNQTMNYKLSDFYIAGSFNSYSPMGGNIAYCSLNQIRNVLVKGARFLTLDVYDNDFSTQLNSEEIGFGSNPCVRNKKQYILGDVANKPLKLDDCFSIIKEFAWSVEHNYPLILYLNLMYHPLNKKVSNMVGESLKKYFKDHYPDKKYGYARYKIGNEDIKNFLGKIIVITNRQDNSNLLDEMIHGYLFKDVKESKFIQGYTYSKLLNNRGDPSGKFLLNKLIRKTKDDLVILFPEEKEKNNLINPLSSLYNFNINKLSSYGINILLMNYSVNDDNIKKYQDFFKTGGFKIKPINLLNKNIDTIVTIKQDKKLSLEPNKVKPVNKYGPNNLFI